MQKHFRIFLFLSLLFLVVFTQSCRKTEEAEALVFPDILLRDATYLLGRSDEEDILFKAKEIDIYIDDEKAELKDSEFEQKKEKSEDLLISGRADIANINTRTYESSLKGNVHLLLHEDNNSIDADEIVWDKDNGEIISNGSLTLNYGDVTVSGLDFKGNIKTGVFTFRTIISGVIKGEAPVEETPVPSMQEVPSTTPEEEQTPESTKTEETPEIEEEMPGEITDTEEITTPPTQEEQLYEPTTPEIETPEPETSGPEAPPTSETQEEIATEMPETEETVQPEAPEPTPEETPTTTPEEPLDMPTEFPSEAPEESYTEVPEETPSTDTSTEITPSQTEMPVDPETTETPTTEETQEETPAETQAPPQSETDEEITETEDTEQNVQIPEIPEIPEKDEETPKEIETFEPIVDIIVITRDGKIVE